MSRFKVGDRVRRISNREQRLEVSNIDMSDGTFYAAAENLWYFQHDFELVSPPQPVESPDDWVTQDLVPSRRGIDELNWIFSGERHGGWVPFRNGPPITHGVTDKCGDIGQVRCRRRDYPQKPAEVHTGGPYVAHSEYERVCVERDNLQEIVKAHEGILLDSIERHGKSVFVGTPNGWPLIPVDPSCIPDGHRAVEVTCATAGKLVASSDGNARHFNGTHIVPRLVVEPIPTPQSPDALPRPEFPVWIRAGWWVAMDADKEWFAYDIKPLPDEADSDWYVRCNFTCVSNPTESMQSIPADRWREAKWQVE